MNKYLLLFVVMLGNAVYASAETISIAVPGPGAASYMPLELISKIGTDKAEGVEVKVIFASSGGSALSELTGNNADFAVVGMPAAMSLRLKDQRIIAIAAVNDLPLYALMVREGLRREVTKIADLKGRVIGLHGDSSATKNTSQQVLELLFRRGGVPPESYRKVSVGRRWDTEGLMLRTGSVDAVIADEPHATRMVEEKVAFPLLHLGHPDTARLYPGAGFLRGALIGRSDNMHKEPARYEKMVRIMQKTLQWIASHTPEEVVDKLEIPGADERKRFIRLIRDYPRQYSQDGRFSARQLSETEIFFIDAQRGNPAAEALRIESMVVDRWAGRKD